MGECDRGRHGGFSLVEVLVAAAIMALGLSGLASLLIQGVAATADAEYRTTAAVMADSLAAQMRLAPRASNTFLSPPPAAAPACDAAQYCAPDLFAARAVFLWHAHLARHLPEGYAIVCRDTSPDDGTPDAPACDGAGGTVIKIFWRDRLGTPGAFERFSFGVPA